MPTSELRLELPPSFTFSQSSLQDYVDCPRRFQLRYIEQLAWPAVETEPVLENERRQQEGALFHRMAQQYLIGLPAEKLTPLATSPDLACWWDNFLSATAIQNLRTISSLHTEITLVAPVGTQRLLGKYDLITLDASGKATIYDWKTYLKRPRDERMAARLQTSIYRALLVQAGATLNGGKPLEPQAIEMIYWYAGFPSEPTRFPYSTAQYKRDWDALTSLIAEINHHRHFPLTNDEQKCAYCPYRSYCNRGEKAGDMDDLLESELTGTEINFEQVAEIAF